MKRSSAAIRLYSLLLKYSRQNITDGIDPITSDGLGIGGDVHRAISAYRTSTGRKLRPELSELRSTLFVASKKGDRKAVHIAMAMADRLVNSDGDIIRGAVVHEA